jgi:hypothetical protein
LRKLDKPLIFEATMAPLCLRRLFVIVPRADSPLPPQAFVNGAFIGTPEIFDMFVHAKNAFLHWILPPELLVLGMQPPSVSEFLSSCRYYDHSRFLFHPGFANPNRQMQSARMALVQHAMDWASRCEPAPAIPEVKIHEMMASGAATIEEYYRTEYESLWRDSRRIQESLRKLSGAAASR